jgi:hypothetical protein
MVPQWVLEFSVLCTEHRDMEMKFCVQEQGYEQRCSNPGCLVTLTTKFCMVVPNIFRPIIAYFPCIKMHISSHAPSRKHQITVWFTLHYRIVGPQ